MCMRQTINSGSGGDGENSVVAVAKERGQQWEREVLGFLLVT